MSKQSRLPPLSFLGVRGQSTLSAGQLAGPHTLTAAVQSHDPHNTKNDVFPRLTESRGSQKRRDLSTVHLRLLHQIASCMDQSLLWP